jgi:sugar lactone lactonase YvrE
MKTSLVLLISGTILLNLNLRLAAQPVITNQPVNQTVVWGGSATFSVMVTGVGPFTYQWQLNGTNLPNNIISTVAGGNLFNNLPATNTILNTPYGVAQDGMGNRFIADTGNSVIRKVDTNGMTTIVAGNGSASFSGDGGAATNAGLFGPASVAVDPVGNLFIADRGNNRIRKVDTNGVISTVAGNGVAAYAGDNGQATNAEIYSPVGICLDTNGDLFIADEFNSRIRKVGTNGVMTTVAGNGLPGYSTDGGSATACEINYPTGVAMDSSNNLFIADSYNCRIRKVNASGIISTVAGTGTPGYSGDGGLAASAKINYPAAVAVDAARNLFIADSGNNCIRKVGTNNIITTVAGNGTNGFSGDGGMATNANLSGPQNVSVDCIGDLFIADSSNSRIREVGTNGTIVTVAGRNLNDGDFATNATLNSAGGIAFDSVGNFYIADAYNNRVRKVDTNGIITTMAGNGIPAYSGDGGAATNASLNRPFDVALDAFGNLFVADTFNSCIRRVDTNGFISTVAGKNAGFGGDGNAATNASLNHPYGVALDVSGNLFIADTANNRIRKVGTNSIITTIAGNSTFGSGASGIGSAATSIGLNQPYAVTVDASGNVFIADSLDFRVRKVNTNDIITAVVGNGQAGFAGDGASAASARLDFPKGLAVDAAGNLFITDSSNARIRKVDTNNIITTIAGNGTTGYSGDGGPANNASISNPFGLALDANDNLYFVDSDNNRIRKLSFLEYADQPSFTVTNVTTNVLNNNYSVVITSASGSVTSSVVNVDLQLPPVTPTFTSSNGTFNFTWCSVSNLTYQLQYTTNLIAPDWIDLGSPVTATNSSASTTDIEGPDQQRFYRVRLLQ